MRGRRLAGSMGGRLLINWFGERVLRWNKPRKGRDDRRRRTQARRLHSRDHCRGLEGRQVGGPRRDAVPAGAQRVPTHRARQVDLPQLRSRRGVGRPVPPSIRRYEPDEGRERVRRIHQGGRALAGLGLGRAPLLCIRLLRAAVWVRRRADREGPSVRGRPEPGGDQRAARHADTAGRGEPLPQPPGGGEPGPIPAHADGGSSRRGPGCCARRSTWRRGT